MYAACTSRPGTLSPTRRCKLPLAGIKRRGNDFHLSTLGAIRRLTTMPPLWLGLLDPLGTSCQDSRWHLIQLPIGVLQGQPACVQTVSCYLVGPLLDAPLCSLFPLLRVILFFGNLLFLFPFFVFFFSI